MTTAVVLIEAERDAMSALGGDGTWHDGLLMDLLATEFVAADT